MLPVIYSDHGAALLSVQQNAPLRQALIALGEATWWANVEKILIVSAHYRARGNGFQIAESPRFWPDHPAASQVSHVDPLHDPIFAHTVAEHLQKSGFNVHIEPGRLDHGAWTVLDPLLRNKTKPVAMLSTAALPDVHTHLQAGQSLHILRKQGVLLVFSGGIVHNQEAFRNSYLNGGILESISDPGRAFATWAFETAAREPHERTSRLLTWQQTPGASHAQPEPSHWLPFLMACGAAHTDHAQLLHLSFQHGLSTAILRFGT